MYDTEERRLAHLTTRFEESRHALGRSKTDARVQAERLIKRDQEGKRDNEDRSKDEFGQSVRKAFPLADFFLDVGCDSGGQTKRLIELLFGHPHMSPSRAEYAMFMARAVALRSADMSRQIGAVIVDDDGEVLAAGCNEVPKPGGGVYWAGDETDHRDFQKGSDPNALLSHKVLVEMFEELRHRGWLSAELAGREAAALAENAVADKVFDRARITNLIEFGRVVHAEMNALAYAARRGVAIGGRRLFCTTFPCHICARHIIGAGIAEVVYIEPYPKSLTPDLYAEAIQLDPRAGQPDEGKVRFRAFIGVAPRRYMDVFRHGRRKNKLGYALKWDPKSARPTAGPVGNPHLLAEADLCYKLDGVLLPENEN